MESFYQSNTITIYSFHAFFRGCSDRVLFWKFQKISPKLSFVKFFLSSLSCWIHHLYIYWKLNPSQIIVTVSRIFKIAIRVSCGETNSKVAWEFFAFYNFAKYSIILLLVFQKVVLPEISKNFLLTGVASL